jgi:hypothetical protein
LPWTEGTPAGYFGNEENILGLVFILVFGVGARVFAFAGKELGVEFLEGVGDVF